MTQVRRGWNALQRAPVLYTLDKLGLIKGDIVVLDAGFDQSTDGSSQTWFDNIGPVQENFFRGATSGAEASDPTFNGTAGKNSSGEYWSFDGGDYFTYGAANETWMQNLHKDSAIFTIAAWVQLGALGSASICGTRGATASNTGMIFGVNVSNQITFTCGNAGVGVLSLDSALTVAEDVWVFLAISLNEATGANGAILQRNATQELFTSTYVSPAAGNASFTMQIGARGNAFSPSPATSRMANFMAWPTTALTAGQLQALFQATRGKFGV